MPATSTIEDFLDRENIRATIYRVCRAMDRADQELFRQCYHDDAWDDHGYYKGPVADFRPASLFRPPHVKSLSHNITTILIELDGDTAWAESYYLAFSRGEQDGKATDSQFGGRYYDRFERRDGEWKIAHRVAIYDWTRVDEVGGTINVPGAVTGSASRDDPTYTRLSDPR